MIKTLALEDIGFYTLSEHRCVNSSVNSQLWRAELILTDRCNFQCPYCRGLREDLRGTMNEATAFRTVNDWINNGLRNVRFSGGEPTLVDYLPRIVKHCRNKGVERIAVSTNGSSSIALYENLIACGVNDFSISLDSGCCAIGDMMAGNRYGAWNHVVGIISELSKITYVSVGIVFTEDNVADAMQTVLFADSLGVSDIRIIPSAQYNQALVNLKNIPPSIIEKYPILRYRIINIENGDHVRGLRSIDSDYCPLVLDDVAVAGESHFPCIIYMREGGDAIGKTGTGWRRKREEWYRSGGRKSDPICSNNCLDVCREFNNRKMRMEAAQYKLPFDFEENAA